jgi:hypothetical protein
VSQAPPLKHIRLPQSSGGGGGGGGGVGGAGGGVGGAGGGGGGAGGGGDATTAGGGGAGSSPPEDTPTITPTIIMINTATPPMIMGCGIPRQRMGASCLATELVLSVAKLRLVAG